MLNLCYKLLITTRALFISVIFKDVLNYLFFNMKATATIYFVSLTLIN